MLNLNKGVSSEAVLDALRSREFWGDASSLGRDACFVRAMALSVGVAAALAGLRYRDTRSAFRSLDRAFLGLLAGSGGGYYLCRRREMEARDVAVRKAREAASAALSRSPPPAEGPPNDAR